jgi:homoserine O-acetyltransferase
LGSELDDGILGFELSGPEGAPVVVVQGGISAGRHAAATPPDPEPGWWEAIVGPGRAIDSQRYRILGFDFLGGAGASSGPASTGLGARFPRISTDDQARAVAFLLDHLGIAALHAFVGASYGGMVALAFARAHATRVGRLLVLCAAHESHPIATAWRSLQRHILRLGLRAGAEREAVEIARSLAMTTYRSAEELGERFGAGDGPLDACGAIEDYLLSRGREFARRFDAATYLCLSAAIDAHRVRPEEIRVPAVVVASDTDQLVPLPQARELVARLGAPARLVVLRSRFGHDAFLKETGAVARIAAEALSLADPGKLGKEAAR